MWHSFITCSEALKIYITYLNLEPDNIWIYSIRNEQVTVPVLVLYFDSVFDPHSLSSHSCLVLQFLMWSCSFGLRTTSLGFIFWQTYFFRNFETFYISCFHVHFQSFCHFDFSNCLFTVEVFGANVTGKILNFEMLFTFLLSVT